MRRSSAARARARARASAPGVQALVTERPAPEASGRSINASIHRITSIVRRRRPVRRSGPISTRGRAAREPSAGRARGRTPDFARSMPVRGRWDRHYIALTQVECRPNGILHGGPETNLIMASARPDGRRCGKRPQGTLARATASCAEGPPPHQQMLPSASNRCVTPAAVIPPKMSTAHATSETTATISVNAIMKTILVWLILRNRLPILPHAAAGSHIIEPTGPVMGPNAVADVTPPGGRQEPR